MWWAAGLGEKVGKSFTLMEEQMEPCQLWFPLVALDVVLDLREILSQSAINHQQAPAKVPVATSKLIKGSNTARDLDCDDNVDGMRPSRSLLLRTSEPLPAEGDTHKKAWTPPQESKSQPISDCPEVSPNMTKSGKGMATYKPKTRKRELAANAGPPTKARLAVRVRAVSMLNMHLGQGL